MNTRDSLVRLTHGALLWAALTLIQPSRAAITWGPSGVWGGGYQNVAAIQPGGTGVMISGADVAGFQRSTDYGQSWQACNIGAEVDNAPHVAAVVFSDDPNQPNTVYAGIGTAGTSGGFAASTDGGKTWTVRNGSIFFSGNGESAIQWLPNRMPRATGNLIAVDEAGSGTKYLYAGTFKQGLWRSTNGGSTWTCVGLNGTWGNNNIPYYIRSIVLDPNDHNTIYVTCYSNWLYKCSAVRTTSGNGTAGWTHLTGGGCPNKVEELCMIGSNLYAAGSDDPGIGGGVWKSTDGGNTWSRLDATNLDTSATYTGIDGYHSGANDILYVSATNPHQDGSTGWYKTIMKSSNGGSTWTDITKSANVANQIGGPGGPAWWLVSASSNNELGKSGGDFAMMKIDPTNHDRVFAIGRSGIWGTTNATAATPLWYPMVKGMSVTVLNSVAYDPNKPARMYLGNTDYRFLYSTDHGQTFKQKQPTSSASQSTGFSVGVDPFDSTVYLGIGNRDANDNGAIYSIADPSTGSTWTDENLSSKTTAHPLGIVSGKNGSGTLVLLVAVEGGGLYRRVGDKTAAWSQVSSTINPGKGEHVSFAWNKNSANVFAFDPGTGLWRSTDYGASWTKIWAHPINGDDGPGYTGTRGYIVEDPNQEGRLYISADKVWRMIGAQTGTAVTNGIAVPTDLGGPADPGAIAFANGSLYCCDRIASGHNARIYQWSTPATSTTSSNIADATIYPGQAGWPTGLAVSSDGYIYASCCNVGAIVGTPATQTAPGQVTGLSATGNINQIELNWADTPTATGYNIKRSTTHNGTKTLIGTSGSSAFTDSNLAAGLTYYYTVSATNSTGEGPDSTEVNATVLSAPLPPPWTDADIGYVTPVGSANYDTNSATWTVSGAGSNIYTNVDGFNFMYQTWTGDVALITRVLNVENTSAWAKGGLMIRQSLANNAVHATIDVEPPSNGIEFLRRTSSGGNTTGTTASGLGAPYWVQLVRIGNTITGAYSPDGQTWTTLSNATVGMTDPVYVGLVVCSHNTSNLCTCEFDNFSVTAPIPAPPANPRATGGTNQVSLTWNSSSGATSYNVYRSTSANGESAPPIATVAVANYVDTGLAGSTTYYYKVSALNAAGESAYSAEASAMSISSLPAGYLDMNLGAGTPGMASYANGVWTLQGSGLDVFGTNDAFHFVYRTWTNDVQLIAHVLSIGDTTSDPHAKAGVMLRQTLADNAADATCDQQPDLLSNDKGIEFLRRPATGSTTLSDAVAGLVAPSWVQLVRRGDTYSASYSLDGVNWTSVASDTVVMTNPVYVGLFVCAHDATDLVTGVMDHFTVNAPPTCSITNPVNGTFYAAPATITLMASAADSDGGVTNVDFYLNGVKVGQDATSPYSCTTNGVPEGSYALTAVATDNLGFATTSAVVNLTVSNLPPMAAWFPLEEGALTSSTNKTYSVVGGWSGSFSNGAAASPTWVTSNLAPVPAALGGTVAAVSFDATQSTGTDPYILTTYPGVLGTNARTIAGWIKAPATQPNTAAFLSYGDNVTGRRATLRLDTTNVCALRFEVQSAFAVGSTSLTNNAWHHVAVTLPTGGYVSNVLLYVDGNLETMTFGNPATQINTTVSNAQAYVTFGNAMANLTTYGFNGQLDDVRFYTNVLTATQIQELVYSRTPHLVQHQLLPAPLTLSQQDDKLVLSWPGTWVLQSCSVLDAPAQWVDVPNAVSPYTVPVLPQGSRFFRLRSP